MASKRIAAGLCVLVTLSSRLSAADAAAPAPVAASDEATRPLAMDDLSLVRLLELKVATTKTSTSVERTPAAVTVITRQEILSWQYQSVADALNHVTGFYVIDDHTLPNVGVRGIAGALSGESGTIKVMIDGVPVTFHPTAGNWLGPELIPLAAVERIEIVRGPTSSLYGADAFLGVVNVITRDGDILRGGEVRVGSSINDAGHLGYDVDGVLGAPFGPFEVMLSARYNRQDRSGLSLPDSSPTPRLPRGADLATSTEGLELGSFSSFFRVTYHGRKRYRVRLSGRYAYLERNSEFAPWLQLTSTATDPSIVATRISLQQAGVTLSFEAEPISNLSLVAKSTVFHDAPTERDRVDVGSDLFWAQRRFDSRGVTTTLEATWQILKHLQMVSGLEHTIDQEEPLTATRVSKFDLPGTPRGSVLPGSDARADSKTLQNFGALTQLHFTPHAQVALTGGLRYDHHEIYGGQPSGRGTLVLTPFEGIFVKLIAGTAFKAPSPALLYERPLVAGGVLGNPALEPQRLTSGEAQVLYRVSPRVSITSGLSYSVLSDKAQFTRVGVNQEARNLAAVRAWSWETRMDASPLRDLRLSTSWERVWARQTQSEVGYKKALLGSDNAIYPDYIWRASVQWKLSGLPLSLNSHSMLVTQRAASDDNTLEAGERYKLDAYLLMDLGITTVGLQWIGYRETSASLSLRNALNTHAADPGFGGIDYPLTSRTLHLQVRQEL